MIDHLRFSLTLVAALGCGLIAGVFFAFSTFVMKALARMHPPEGMSAMQSINIVVLTPAFLGVFMRTGGLCVMAVILSLMQWSPPHSVYLVAGGVLYLLGTLFVTIAFNVPRNNRLAAVARSDPNGAIVWSHYGASWSAWNHVRGAAA